MLAAMAKITRKSRPRARELRGQMTNAEVILWSQLRRRALRDQKFRRQHPVGPYIADFACSALRLVIEIDGDTHGSQEERAYDERRDAFMRQEGWRVTRISNYDIYRNLPDVLDIIARVVEERVPAERAPPR